MVRIYLFHLLSQIAVLHSNGFVHGNLDPSYIVPYDKDGIIVLDLFMIKYEKDIREPVRRSCKYSKPNLNNIRKINRNEDFWSVGMMALEMCLGEIPFDISEYVNLTKDKIFQLFVNKKYSNELITIIAELLIDSKMNINSLFKKERPILYKNKYKGSSFYTEFIKRRITKSIKEINIYSKKETQLDCLFNPRSQLTGPSKLERTTALFSKRVNNN